MRMRGHRETGSATALALLATLILSAIAAGLASVSFSVNRTGSGLDNSVLAGYAAEAGLEQIKAAVATSEYNITQGNIWLDENAIAYDPDREDFPAPDDIPVWADLEIGSMADRQDVAVDVWVYSMDDENKKYRAVARGKTNDLSVLLAQDIRARDTFARFATFVDKGTLKFGKSMVEGDVHSNDQIEFHYGGGRFKDRVTAARGFAFGNNAHEGNTSFRDQNRFATPIELPTVTDVNVFGEFAKGPYSVRGANSVYDVPGDTLDAQIELLGDQVRLIVTNRDKGTIVSDATHDLPPDGVIFVEGNITSIKGNVSGRVTISTPGTVTVTGDIVYTDPSGNKAMRLEKDGEPVDVGSEPPGQAWKEEDGYRYKPNPDFTLAGDQRPALGLMAGYEIKLDGAGPDNLELHAALFSAAANWTADLDVTKNNLRIFGSITTRTPGARAKGSRGYSGSGEYVYDASLLDNPPPHWLQVDSPFWGPRWRMGW